VRIFITGATGYIGGSVATRLLEAGHQVAGLVRSAEAAAEARRLGIAPVLGALEDADVLTGAAAAADAVINTAEANHRGAVNTLLEALRGTGKAFIHTSGSGIVGDLAAGEPSDRVFTEDTLFEPSPIMVGRAAIDQLILDAAAEDVRTIVLRPSLIYGASLGVRRESFQVPVLIEQAKKSRVPRHVGRGLNIWSHVHLRDLVELYRLALDDAPAGSLYYVESGEASMLALTTAIGRMLGLAAGPEGWPLERAVQEWGPRTHVALGSNSRVRADKARRELGWRPGAAPLFEEIQNGHYRNGSPAK
jgi:nucleoside-diphosphate-sugar epimerase